MADTPTRSPIPYRCCRGSDCANLMAFHEKNLAAPDKERLTSDKTAFESRRSLHHRSGIFRRAGGQWWLAGQAESCESVQSPLGSTRGDRLHKGTSRQSVARRTLARNCVRLHPMAMSRPRKYARFTSRITPGLRVFPARVRKRSDSQKPHRFKRLTRQPTWTDEGDLARSLPLVGTLFRE